MSRHRFLSLALSLLLIFVTGTLVLAQATALEPCPDLVTRALQVVGDACAGQSVNSACYGNRLVEARFVNEATTVPFSREGDFASLAHLRAIRTFALNNDRTQWGVSMLNVQANLPGTLPGQNAIFMLLGGAEIESAVPSEAMFIPRDPITVYPIASAPVLEAPESNAPAAFTVQADQMLLADAVSANSEYVRVTLGKSFGWLASANLRSSVSLNVLPLYVPGESFAPMQAFRLRSAIGSVECAEAPAALIVQGPHDYTVTLKVNGATISLGSTLVFEHIPLTQPAGVSAISGLLRVSVLDGHAIIAHSDGTTTEIAEGYQSRIFLADQTDSEGNTIQLVSGEWSTPQRISEEFRWRYHMLDGLELHYAIQVVTPETVNLLDSHTPAPVVTVNVPSQPAQPAPASHAAPVSESRVTICHRGRETITIGQSAANSHLAQHTDDYAGACQTGNTNGNANDNGNGNGNNSNGNAGGNGNNNGNGNGNGNAGGNGNGNRQGGRP